MDPTAELLLIGPAVVVWGILLTFIVCYLVRSLWDPVSLGAPIYRKLALALFLVLVLLSVLFPLLPPAVSLCLSFLTGAVLAVLLSFLRFRPLPSDFRDTLELSGGFYGVALVVIVGVAFTVRTIGVGQSGLIIDEGHHFQAAKTYLHRDAFPFWTYFGRESSEIYDRAWLYTIQVGEVMRAFGTSLTAARFVSVVWGVALLGPALWLGKLLDFSRVERLTVAWWLTTSTFFLSVSRWLRMYSMFLTVFLTWIVVLYKFLHAQKSGPRYRWGSLAVLLGLISLHLHTLTVSVLPGIFLYVLLRRDTPFRVRSAVSIGVIVVLVAMGVLGIVKGAEHLNFERILFFNYLYPVFMVQDQLGYALGGLVMVSVFFEPRQSDGLDFLGWVIGVSLLLFVCFTDRYMAYRYVSHLLVLAYFPLVRGWYSLTEKLSGGTELTSPLRTGLTVLVFLLPGISFVRWLPDVLTGYMGGLYTHIRLLRSFGFYG